MLSNVDDGGFGIDAMSRHIAGMYVPGVDLHSLTPKTADAPDRLTQIRAVLTSIGNGVEHERAPGLAARLPAPVRARIAAALESTSSLEWLGDETLGPRHFNADPTVTTLSRYRVGAAPGFRYFTIRQAADGRVIGVIVED